MDKTMEVLKKLLYMYYTENYETWINEGSKKTWYITRTLETLILNRKKKLWLYTKIIEVFEQIYSFRTLI